MKTEKLGAKQTQVSNMCLGTMYFGSRVSQENAFSIMDYYFEQGGRFLDTSNNYCFWLDGFSGDESETVLGQWMHERKNRKDVFLSTKCGVRPTGTDPQTGDLQFEGISRNAVLKAVEGSLERLQTDYIDLYMIHVDWRQDPLEQTLEALDSLVKSGTVKHIGCSNMSTWRMVQAKMISRQNNWAEFDAIQQWYSYLKPRDRADLWVQKFVNDDLLDYCESENDISIMAYTATLGGLYKWNSIYDKNHPALNNRFFTESNERRLSAIQKVAADYGVSPFQIVFAWMMKHSASIVPVLGVRTLEQLKDNLDSLKLNLSEDEFDFLNDASFNNMRYKEEKEVALI